MSMSTCMSESKWYKENTLLFEPVKGWVFKSLLMVYSWKSSVAKFLIVESLTAVLIMASF